MDSLIAVEVPPGEREGRCTFGLGLELCCSGLLAKWQHKASGLLGGPGRMTRRCSNDGCHRFARRLHGHGSVTWRGETGRKALPHLNRSGAVLSDCARHSLSITNSMFENKGVHRCTWHQDPTGRRTMFSFVVVSASGGKLAPLASVGSWKDPTDPDALGRCAGNVWWNLCQEGLQPPSGCSIRSRGEPETPHLATAPEAEGMRGSASIHLRIASVRPAQISPQL